MQRLLRLNIGLILLGLGVAVAWVLATSAETSFEALSAFRPHFAPLLVGLSVFCIAVRFLRWQYMLRRLEVRIPTRGSAVAYLASLVGIATPAHVGEALRCVLLRRRFGTPLGPTLEALVAERVLDVVALALLGTAARPAGAGTFAIAVAVAAGIAALAAALARAAGYPVRIFRALRRLRDLGAALALSLVAWGGASLLLSMAAASVGQPIGAWAGIHLYALSTLLGAATLTPAGVGTTGSIAILGLRELGLTADGSVVAVSIMRLMSTGLALAVGAVFAGLAFRGLRRAPAPAPAADAAAHFDALGSRYAGELSGHVWSHLLERKTRMLHEALAGRSGRGLDLGCGLGAQARELRRHGHRVVGVDAALGLLQAGAREGPGEVPVANASAVRLPFADASLDFVYAVGVLHHLGGAAAQAAALREAARVLGPGGLLLVHETNPRNPLYRLYMGYVFPIVRSIDEGVERWLEPRGWSAVEGFRLRALRYFTFLPDFTPRVLLPAAGRVEAWLETTPMRRWSVHYFAVLERVPAGDAGSAERARAGAQRGAASGVTPRSA